MFSSDLLIHPARQETAGMVLIEALTYGLPVLCTENCGYSQTVNEAGCSPLASLAEPKDIAGAIRLKLEENQYLAESIKKWVNQENRYATAQIILNKMKHSLH